MPTKQGRRLDRGALVLLSFGACVIAIVGSFAQPGAIPAPRPGPVPGGATLLPNGWRIDPAGRHTQVGDLPLNMVMSPDGRFIVVTNNGWTKPTLTVFDTKTEQVIGRAPVDHAWLGLAWDPAGTRLFSAGAAENTVHEFAWADGALKDAGVITLGAPERRTGGELLNAGFIGGLAMAPDGTRLYATHVFGQAVSAIDLADSPRDSQGRARGRAVHVRALRRRQDPVRVALGRCQSADVRGRHARASWGSDGRRPPQLDAAFEGRRQALRRLRQHQRGMGRSTWRLVQRWNRSRSPSIPTRRSGRRRTAWRCRPTAARCWWPTPTTTTSRWSISGSRGPAGLPAGFRSAGIRRRSCTRPTGAACSCWTGRG